MTTWALSWHHVALGIPEIWNQNITGNDVTVAILDSGLTTAPGLTRSDFEYRDASGAPVAKEDTDGHGTCCASVIANYQGGTLGIAPFAKIVSLRVLGVADSVAAVEAAFGYILRERADVDVVSCSFVMARVTAAILDNVRALADSGRVIVGAAGDSSEYASPFPERTERTLVVSAIDENRQPLSGARAGRWIDCAAPGARIPVAVPATSEARLFGESSAAAAVTAGVAALVLSAIADRAQRRRFGRRFPLAVKRTATPLPYDGPVAVGDGLLNPQSLLAEAVAPIGDK
jgi:subtilisin family serine protease